MSEAALKQKMKKEIPFFDYKAVQGENPEELFQVIRDVVSKGAFILQKDLKEFELNLAHLLNVKHAFGVANGTDALLIALLASGIKSGDEVILPSHTYVATAAAVHYIGARPVLVECGSDHLMDPASVKSALTSKTRALLPVHLNGRTCCMDILREIAEINGLIIIEDAAQALGARFKGKHAGTFGSVGTFSFYPAKVLGCFGDGGAVVTHDDKIAERITRLRDHGRDPEGDVVGWGLNSRLDNLQAAVLNFKFPQFLRDIKRRREIASLYQENLKGVRDFVLPPAPDSDSDYFDVFQNYEVESGRREALRSHLKKEGIGTVIQWGGTPLHRIKNLKLDFKLPFTDKLFERCLMLPMNPSLSNDDVATISDSIRRFYGVA